MRGHWRYLRYVLRHKWYVAWECFRRRLYWRGITHDLSKFLPSEWCAYVHYFYGPHPPQPSATGWWKKDTGDDPAFDLAWVRHQNRNQHHWQWFVLPLDDGGLKVLEMDCDSRAEMLCDWLGAGKAQGHGIPLRVWYQANRDKMMLAPRTRAWIESQLLEAK